MLSFDLEEFDVPAEYGIDLKFDEQIRISKVGLERILELLDKHQITATFFTTVVFAEQQPELIRRIIAAGHELGSHGWYHSSFENEHLAASRAKLREMFGVEVNGFRMARMMDVDHQAIRNAGYKYNSSLNPTYLPGRYNNFSGPRTVFDEDGLLHLPASVTPFFRLPLFWLSFHHFSLWFYKAACRRTINHDRYLNLYFHPWEFADLKTDVPGLPWLITRNSGKAMVRRFDEMIRWMKRRGYFFDPIENFLSSKKQIGQV
jgi:peptidoglycan/xylan/chitin deacetylase (PgdA/CDA1 family)